jgi:hypothetical protein
VTCGQARVGEGKQRLAGSKLDARLRPSPAPARSRGGMYTHFRQTWDRVRSQIVLCTGLELAPRAVRGGTTPFSQPQRTAFAATLLRPRNGICRGNRAVGRPRKPTTLRVLQGNAGKRPLPKGEPRPPKGAACPKWMGVEEQNLWAELAPVFEEINCLTIADAPAFASWMIELARIKPAKRMAKRCLQRFRRSRRTTRCNLAGTPASRARVTVAAPQRVKDECDLYG